MFDVEWDYPIKNPYISLTIGVRNVKMTYRKWPDNLFQNLTFDPCFKLNGVIILIMAPRASECKKQPMGSPGLQFFAP